MSDDGGESADLGMFQEPDDFRPKTPEHTIVWHTPPAERLPREDSSGASTSAGPSAAPGTSKTGASQEQQNDSSIYLRLVGFSPLWGHLLWNAAPTLSEYLLKYQELLLPAEDTCVLELGAASGLPSIVAAKYAGKKGSRSSDRKGKAKASVVSTDYPDPDLVANLKHNLERNQVLFDASSDAEEIGAGRAVAEGYIWGSDRSKILSYIQDPGPRKDDAQPRKFDLILLSDLVFNHQAHDAMLTTCEQCLRGASSENRPVTTQSAEDLTFLEEETQEESPEQGTSAEYELPPFVEPGTPCCLVFYTHHRPQFTAKDLEFFVKARSRGWTCSLVVKRKMPVMFKEDPGSEEVRGTVWGWAMTKAQYPETNLLRTEV